VGVHKGSAQNTVSCRRTACHISASSLSHRRAGQLTTQFRSSTMLLFVSEYRPVIQITDTHTHPFNGPFSGTTQVSRYQKGITNLDFTEARDIEWQWHQLGHMQSLHLAPDRQPHQHPTTLVFLQAGCPSCRPTNSVKALKAKGDH